MCYVQARFGMSDGRDISMLFTTRILRLFAYGFLSVVLALYLAAAGLSEWTIGVVFSLTLAGDAGVSLWLTTHADRFGRRRTLIAGAVLMILAGIAFLLTRNVYLLALAAIIGVISPSGNEIGPFLSVEQASLAQLLPDERRTHVFAWYSLAGSFATALGALAGGWLSHALQAGGWTVIDSYRVVLEGYALAGLVLLLCFLGLGRAVEVSGQPMRRSVLGLHKSRGVVFKLAALFSVDAFAGGLVVQSLVAYWFSLRFGVDPGVLGSIFFGANLLAGFSALLAARLARRIGLINTMVFTHIPSNILLIMVPLMPTLALAIAVLLMRFSISQMDVPTRQSYTMAVVEPEERSAAAGVTNIARSIGAALAPSLTGVFLGVASLLGAPFILAGSLKLVYDVTLWRQFHALKPPEESN
jgi:MFS family permease